MNRRPELAPIFRSLLGSKNVYFQPAEDLKLSFPCILYKLTDIKQVKADNQLYTHTQAYEVTYITSNPDDALVDEMLRAFRFIKFKHVMIVNDMYHYRYILYY